MLKLIQTILSKVTDSFKLYVGLAVVIIVAAVLAWGAWSYHSLKVNAAKVPELERTIDNQKATIAAMRLEQDRVQAISEGYQNELEAIHSRPVSNSPVRLCYQSNTVRSVSSQDTTSNSSSDGTPASGVVSGNDGVHNPEGTGPDIGPDLRALAKRAEQVSAQTRGLIAFAR